MIIIEISLTVGFLMVQRRFGLAISKICYELIENKVFLNSRGTRRLLLALKTPLNPLMF